MHEHAGHTECECPRTADLDGDSAAAASRRSFLRNSGLLGAGVGAAGLGLLGAAPAQAASAKRSNDPYDQTTMAPAAHGRWNPDCERAQFTVIVMPDTQYLFDQDRIHPVPLEESFEYVLSCAQRKGLQDDNVVFLAHLGDVTQNGLAEEYAAATKVFDLLDEQRVAYSVLAGNHDVSSSTTDQRGATPYLDTFNPKRFARSSTWHAASPDGYNNAHIFRAGGRGWLLLSLDWRMSTAGFDWANAVIKANPTLPVIVTTHDLVYADDSGAAYLDDYGQQLWDGLIKDNDQIFLTLNGHYWPPGSTTMKNTAGNDVFLHITNYQNRYYGGAAMIRAYRFDLERGTIDVETFSPWIGKLMAAGEANALAVREAQLSSAVDRFSIAIDFDERFDGFAPVKPRPSRPAKEMLVRGTVAYWRFDGLGANGASVGGGTVIKDRTGLGNDLALQTVSGTPAGALTYSSAYHPDQPGHASLAFTGQGSPIKGSYLQTVASAPINANEFEHGYTFEAFFYLPADWNSDQNAWSAILSRWGTAGQAGKSAGNTDPNEPIATLSLSGDRELQWCVYPLNLDDESTNWGHELPLGAWWHVAVVNDGAITKLYVDGCEVARNPATPANGLVSLNLPWMLGGYEYQGSINQVFHGSIGDVRIVDRALPVSRFMVS
ncbi:MAG TPA: LamG-like jellyroll fold domain-containing protein [Actinospica sp.]|nr:LamG-like jellyroll fold domain-containing protein [Actinospica sp.]